MANTNDYFVSFGSNADTWAADIEKHVKGVKATVDDALASLES
jgi:hypothetical protein